MPVFFFEIASIGNLPATMERFFHSSAFSEIAAFKDAQASGFFADLPPRCNECINPGRDEIGRRY